MKQKKSILDARKDRIKVGIVSDKSVGMAMGQTVPFQLPAGQDSSLFHSVHTGSEAHSAYYPLCTGVKRLERETDHLPPSYGDVKNAGAIPPHPYMSLWCSI